MKTIAAPHLVSISALVITAFLAGRQSQEPAWVQEEQERAEALQGTMHAWMALGGKEWQKVIPAREAAQKKGAEIIRLPKRAEARYRSHEATGVRRRTFGIVGSDKSM